MLKARISANPSSTHEIHFHVFVALGCTAINTLAHGPDELALAEHAFDSLVIVEDDNDAPDIVSSRLAAS